MTKAGFGARLLLLCCAGGAVGGLLAGWAPRLDILNTFLPFWLIGGTMAYVAAVAGGGRTCDPVTLLPLALIAVAALPPLTREWLAGRRSVSPPGGDPTLRLIQFNAFKDNADPVRAARWILQERPDVITMEEMRGASHGILNLLAAQYPFQVSCLSRMRCSTVILSRIPAVASGGLAHGDPENRQALSAVWARFTLHNRPYTLVAVHMQRPWPWGDQRPGRNQLVAFLDTVDRRHAIVAGDFNLTPWNATMRAQDQSIALPRLTRALASWPAFYLGGLITSPLLPIDQVYAGKGWRLLGVTRGPWAGSDHYPLIVRMNLRDPG